MLAVGIYLTSVLLGLLVAVICLQRRYVSPTARFLPLVMAGIVWWGLCQTLQLAPVGDTLRTLGFLAFPFAMPLAAGGYWFTVKALVDTGYRPSQRESTAFVASLVVVAATLSVPVTRDLVMTQLPSQGERQVWQLGPLFWVMGGLTAIVFGVSGAIEVREMRHASSLQRLQLGSNFAGAVIPAVGMVATCVQLIGQDGRVPLPLLEWTSLGFILTGLLDLYSLQYQGLLSLVPVARGLILEELGQAVLVFDPEGRLVDLNGAARALLGSSPDTPRELLGRRQSFVLSCLGPGVRATNGEYRLRSGAEVVEIDLRVQLIESGGQVAGQAIVIRDVTGYNASRRALAAANDQLREQLRTIDGLRLELAEQATRDSLTGLHNRRFLDGRLTAEVVAAHENGAALAVGILDVDHFKSINDRFGHLVGDQVLVAIGQRLAAHAQAPLSVARFGGEEFVVLMPGVEPVAAAATLCRLQRQVSAAVIETDSGPLSITMSGGLSSLSARTATAHELLAAADLALYAAKAGGRNRVEIAGAPAR